MIINYNQMAGIYDDVRDGSLELLNSMLEKYPEEKPLDLLEIGCGTGNNIRILSRLANTKLFGIDNSSGMLDKAREKCPGADLREGDATTLDCFEPELFDIVYMVDVIHHIRDIKTMFSNISRVLKKGGRVFVFTDSHDRIKNHRLTSKYFPETVAAELERYQDTDEIIESMQSNGFIETDVSLVETPKEDNIGRKMIECAQKKGFSMFYLIPEEAIQRGIERIREDMKQGTIDYIPRTTLVQGRKPL